MLSILCGCSLLTFLHYTSTQPQKYIGHLSLWDGSQYSIATRVCIAQCTRVGWFTFNLISHSLWETWQISLKCWPCQQIQPNIVSLKRVHYNCLPPNFWGFDDASSMSWTLNPWKLWLFSEVLRLDCTTPYADFKPFLRCVRGRKTNLCVCLNPYMMQENFTKKRGNVRACSEDKTKEQIFQYVPPAPLVTFHASWWPLMNATVAVHLVSKPAVYISMLLLPFPCN